MKPRTPSAQRSGRNLKARSTSVGAPAGKPRLKPLVPLSQLKNILVPTDFSEYSQEALEYALMMAKQFGARITLLYVVEPPIFTDFQATPLALDERRLTQAAREKLNVFREQLGNDAKYLQEVKAVVGKPFEQITSLARGLRQDLIIISTHGRTGLKHVLLGSTAEKVVRHATCPVLVVRQPKR